MTRIQSLQITCVYMPATEPHSEWTDLVERLWHGFTECRTKREWADDKVKSQRWINQAHNAVKQQLIDCGAPVDRICPELQSYDGMPTVGRELSVPGFMKDKNVDVAVAPSKPGDFDASIVVAVRSQWMSVGKNVNSNLETFVGEATNMHLAFPGMVLGQLMILPVYENKIADETGAQATTTPVNIAKFIRTYGRMAGRQSAHDREFLYEEASLLIVDNSGPVAAPITSLDQLRESTTAGSSARKALDQLSDEEFARVSCTGMVDRLVTRFHERHGAF